MSDDARGEMLRPPFRVTYLEMRKRPPVAEFGDFGTRVLRASPFSAWYLMALHDAVGRDYFWLDMHQKTPAEVEAFCADPRAALYTLMDEGEPAGFFVLKNCGGEEVVLRYFGLTPNGRGKGLGAALLDYAIGEAWRMPATRVLSLDTCSLDDPRALPLYLSRGFDIIREEDEPALYAGSFGEKGIENV